MNDSYLPVTERAKSHGLIMDLGSVSCHSHLKPGVILTSPTPTASFQRVCVGILLKFPPEKNCHTLYLFGLHNTHALPWDYHSISNKFFLQSTRCIGWIDETHQSEVCCVCEDIRSNDNYTTMMDRIKHGVHC